MSAIAEAPLPMPAQSMGRAVGRGVVAGLAGTVVMTAFQRLVEMPISGRKESYQPADLLDRVLGVRPKRPRDRRRLNHLAHFGVGLGWGAAHGAASHALGLRGQKAVAAVFGTLWPGDVTSMTLLGLGEPPWRWSRTDLAVDVADKLVLAEATGLVFDGLSRRRSNAP